MEHNRREKPSVFSDREPIQSLIENTLLEINRAGIMVHLKKMIPYGTQLFLEGQEVDGLINVYFSEKKGLSFVDCSNNSTSSKVIDILRGTTQGTKKDISESERKLNAWIGTDESGKGDFFGPLVVAGFFITRDIESDILQLGVTDSKNLSSRQIQSIAGKLRKKYHEHISIVAPSNARYNELYKKIGNLNKLLAWGHARAIENLVQNWQNEKNMSVDGVVSDQFGNEQYIRNALSSMKRLNLIQRPRGESNSAVAAASIIARDTFTKHITRIQKECGMKIPFGAGPEVLKAAKQFALKNGKEKLVNIAKIHFKTFKQI